MRLCCAAVKVLLLLGVLAPGLRLTAAADEPARRHRFNVPAGAAEPALKLFAVQSGRQILFPTEVVAEARTNEVKGRYTMEEALDLLLAGTGLFPREDESSGAISIGRLTGQSRVVELPLFVVRESPHAPWRYAAVPGLEVLSRCPDATTASLIAQNQRLLQLLELLVPARFQVRSDVPSSYVLYATESQPAIAREIIAELEKSRHVSGGEGQASEEAWSVRVLPNYRFWDQDSQAIFFIFSGSDFNKGRLTLAPDYLRYRLQARAPALPVWFVEGMLELYRSITLEPAMDDLGRLDEKQESAVHFWPMTWLAEDGSQPNGPNLRDAREAVDLAGLLGKSAPAEADLAAGSPGREAAALFVRWALTDPSGTRREALWKLLDGARDGSVSEARFRDCFGLSYAAAGRELAAYRAAAATTEFILPLPPAAALPSVTLRDATASEISRIKGDLERLEIAYVDALYPQLTHFYITQARRTLRLAYDQGDRDPRLLASLGLCECEAGEDAAARPLLEAAVAQAVVRPRAYYELARIYFEELRQKDPRARFTPAEAGRVLQPLAAARRQAPPLAEVYELIAEVWLRSDGRLESKHLAVLDEGLAYFPRRGRLIYATALLHAMHGRNDEALALAERALGAGPDAAQRERLQQLRAALRGEKSPATPREGGPN